MATSAAAPAMSSTHEAVREVILTDPQRYLV